MQKVEDLVRKQGNTFFEVNEEKAHNTKKETPVEGEKVSYQSAFNFNDGTSGANLQREENTDPDNGDRLKEGEFKTVEAV